LISIDGFEISAWAKFTPEALVSTICELFIGGCVGEDCYGEEEYCNFYHI